MVHNSVETSLCNFDVKDTDSNIFQYLRWLHDRAARAMCLTGLGYSKQTSKYTAVKPSNNFSITHLFLHLQKISTGGSRPSV